MQTKTWKKERDLLEEAYGTVTETDHSTLRAAQTDEENAEDDRKAAGLKKQGEIMKKDLEDESKQANKVEEASVDEMLPEPGAIMQREPDEVDSEIESLKNLILNPPADKIEEYAQQGQLHVYVDMLKKKLEHTQVLDG